jgi:NTE family protein
METIGSNGKLFSTPFQRRGEMLGGLRQFVRICVIVVVVALVTVGCAHYPLNQPLKQSDPQSGYRAKYMGTPGNSENLLLYLTFSGGGTRAAALSYGVLEELRQTEVVIEGRKRRLLDEVDGISSVSGGSFTAGYYGLFGDRIFEDFETKFLKKNVEGALARRTFLSPANWFRLASGTYGRSDLAAAYYDKHVFESGTFGDMADRRGPMIMMNATDMTHGIRVGFNQDAFDLICSDLSPFPVARAAAASSAVPILLSPINLRNYAGPCGSEAAQAVREALENSALSERERFLSNHVAPFLDSQKKPYIHLVDGGVSDNLGLRAILDRILLNGSVWETIKGTPTEEVHKVVLIVVNAETKPDTKWDRSEGMPSMSAMMSAYSSIVIERYNEATLALMKEDVESWAEEIRDQRCKGGGTSTAPGSCEDIEFYVVEMKFDALKGETERMYFDSLPTSFNLTSEQVDRLRDAAHRILVQSEEFKRFLGDLQ